MSIIKVAARGDFLTKMKLGEMVNAHLRGPGSLTSLGKSVKSASGKVNTMFDRLTSSQTDRLRQATSKASHAYTADYHNTGLKDTVSKYLKK